MAAFPEGSTGRKPTGLMRLAPVLLLVFFNLSCSRENILIISDPHIEAARGGPWVPAGRGFRLASRLRGYSSAAVTTGSPDELADIISANASDFGIIVVSPFHSGNLPVSVPAETRLIVAGGYPAEGNGSVEYVTMDRTEAVGRMGELAAGEADESGTVLLLVNLNTEARNREFTVFMDSFRGFGGENPELTVIDIARQPEKSLPDDFIERAGEAGLLVLLAASHNRTAILISEEAATPVMTESARQAGFRTDRVVASVEDDGRAFRKALISLITGKAEDGVSSYSARLRRN